MLRFDSRYIKDLEKRCKESNFYPFDPRIGADKKRKIKFVWDELTVRIAEEWLKKIAVKHPVYPEIGNKYLHYKGGIYEVITLATHSETEEKMVVYKSIHFGSIHVRPLKMWFDLIKDKNGMPVRRFELHEI